ncbi:DUF2383 domain-containing protein [Marinicrinis lubricantis]|uniref:DUF2383 domain-containing protein n=1 Tax=Marinicrinis lubricantis TaxID=2086470 RepID=A0ABW1IKM7_9BACL
MHDKQHVIKELNKFLRGRYMGVHQYEQLIQHAQNPLLKEKLQQFQEHAKLGAQKVAKRIEQLGGTPTDDVGVMGKIQIWLKSIKGYPEQTDEILHDALVGENKYGIHLSHEMVAGELDEESTKLIDSLLEEDQKRVDQIRQWIQSHTILEAR